MNRSSCLLPAYSAYQNPSIALRSEVVSGF